MRHIARAMDTQCDFCTFFGYTFFDLDILLAVTRGFHWRRVSNKPVRHAFLFLLFIMRVTYINNETRDFLGAQQNHLCCKNLNSFVNSGLPL